VLLPQPKHRDLFGVRETLLRPEDKAANNNEKLKKENESLKEKNRLLELKVTLLINERVTRSKTNLENMSNNENTNAPSIAPSIDSINHQKYMSKANVIDPSANIKVGDFVDKEQDSNNQAHIVSSYQRVMRIHRYQE
jgi:hypothetical protein